MHLLAPHLRCLHLIIDLSDVNSRSGPEIWNVYSGLGLSAFVNSTQTCDASGMHPVIPRSNLVIRPRNSKGFAFLRVRPSSFGPRIWSTWPYLLPVPSSLLLPKREAFHKVSPFKSLVSSRKNTSRVIATSSSSPGIAFSAPIVHVRSFTTTP